MSLITIQTFTLPAENLADGNSYVLRLWYNQSFLDSSGQAVASGTSTTGTQLRSDATVSGGFITFDPFTVYSTLDALTPNPQAIQINCQLFKGNTALPIYPFNQISTPNSWIVPNDLGGTISFEEWTIANQRISLYYAQPNWYTAAQVDALIQAGIIQAALNQDYVTADYASFALAVAAATVTGGTLVINESVTATTMTVPANVTLRFTRKGSLTVTTGQTVTILGPIEADPVKIFFNALSGEGTVSFTANPTLSVVYPEWWGAVSGASSTVTMGAFQRAVDTGKIVYAGGTSYTLNNSSSPLMFDNNTLQVGILEGGGQGVTQLTFTSTANAGIELRYLAAGIPFASIRNLNLRGAAGATPSHVSGNHAILLRGFLSVRHVISGLIIENVTIDRFGDDAIRLQGPAGPIYPINVHISDCAGYGIKLLGDSNAEVPQNTSIFGGTIRGKCAGGIAVDGNTTTVRACLIEAVDVELEAEQTTPNIYLKNTSGGIVNGGSCSSSVSSLATGDARIYFDSGATRWDITGVQNVANSGTLAAFGGDYLPLNYITEGESFPTRKPQIIAPGFSAGVDNQSANNIVALEADIAPAGSNFLAMYLKNTNAAGISRFALGMLPDATDGFLYQYDAATADTLFFNRATAGTLTFQTSIGQALMIANDRTVTAATALKVANTGKFALVPKTDDVWASSMTISVLISNHVIAASFTTSGTATMSPSTAGAAGDILQITTEADASGTVVVTFGGTFHSSGTQTTTASHFSKIQFSSDGTRWTEDFRTTNLA